MYSTMLYLGPLPKVQHDMMAQVTTADQKRNNNTNLIVRLD